ncbi:hypothetical protein [Kytococcus sp. Marseille-QA3725]
MAVDPNKMSPQDYLQHLNEESARRRAEQTARLLGDRATTQPSAQGGDLVETTVSTERSTRASSHAAAPSTSTTSDTTTSPTVSGEEEGAQTIGQRLVSPGHWVGGLLWAALAGGATALWPGVGQILTGRWFTGLALFLFYGPIEDFLRWNPDLQLAVGQTGETLARWFWWVVIAHAMLSALRSTFAPKNPTGTSSTEDDEAEASNEGSGSDDARRAARGTHEAGDD